MFFSWLFEGTNEAARKPARREARLGLEVLEGRAVPATLTWAERQ